MLIKSYWQELLYFLIAFFSDLRLLRCPCTPYSTWVVILSWDFECVSRRIMTVKIKPIDCYVSFSGWLWRANWKSCDFVSWLAVSICCEVFLLCCSYAPELHCCGYKCSITSHSGLWYSNICEREALLWAFSNAAMTLFHLELFTLVVKKPSN